ncbi:MAG: hypothetical protein C5B43_03035 [Verrucomicrobia bacterium]|nr:MAG: hypothetical protein C5B43_03035 [Verrucomicrobiota bacterium]
MSFTEEQEIEVFKEWMQRILSKGKQKLMLDKCDSATISFEIPDSSDPNIHAEINILIRRKNV